jgi:hypothetical protein
MLRRIRFSAILSLAATTTTPSFSHFAAASNPSAALTKNNKTAAFVVSASGGVAKTHLFSSTSNNNNNSISGDDSTMTTSIDHNYPGTAVERMLAVRARVAELAQSDDLVGKPWEDMRRKILWAGGLRDLPDSIPGQGYTGHSFNDYNHVDLTCMAEAVSNNQNDGNVVVKEIARGNLLGPGIRMASLPELGPGGSWSTCANGCNVEPPRDVAHIQFRARVAFKLVWVPNAAFDVFVLVDDDGNELARGSPTEGLPSIRQRQLNYSIMQGSKYAVAAENIAKNVAAE